MSARKNLFVGRWRIVWMAQWDKDFVDMEVPGHFTFGGDGLGTFQFGLVQGELDGRVAGGCMEFSWAGRNELDEAFGRGRAVIEDGELCGHIFFHLGDDSAFRAVRVRRRVVGRRSR